MLGDGAIVRVCVMVAVEVIGTWCDACAACRTPKMRAHSGRGSILSLDWQGAALRHVPRTRALSIYFARVLDVGGVWHKSDGLVGMLM